MRRSHLLNRGRTQDSMAIQFAAVKQHSSIKGKVIGCREEPRVAGNTAQGICPRIVDFADHPPPFTNLSGCNFG